MAKVIWTELALADLDEVARYIALDKLDAAKNFVRLVFSRVEHLELFPRSGGKPRALNGTPYRQLVVLPLKIFYRISAERIYIVYVMRSERRFMIQDVVNRDS